MDDEDDAHEAGTASTAPQLASSSSRRGASASKASSAAAAAVAATAAGAASNRPARTSPATATAAAPAVLTAAARSKGPRQSPVSAETGAAGGSGEEEGAEKDRVDWNVPLGECERPPLHAQPFPERSLYSLYALTCQCIEPVICRPRRRGAGSQLQQGEVHPPTWQCEA